MKKLISIVTMCVICSIYCLSQELETINITPLGFSGNFLKVVSLENKQVLALANNDCLYVSVDSARTWSVKEAPFKGAVELKKFDDGIYLYNSETIYRSIDNGISWNKFETNGIPKVLESYKMEYEHIFYKNTDTLFISATNRVNGSMIYRTINGGRDWTLVAERLYGKNILDGVVSLHFISYQKGYAFGAGYYAETNDCGATWTKYVLDNYETYFYDGIVTNGVLIQSYASSSVIVSDLENVVWYKAGIHRFVSMQGKVIGNWNQTVHYTSDDGQTWQTKKNTEEDIFNDICCLDENVMIQVGRNLTSYVTVDGGETWTKYVHGGGEGFNKIYCKNEKECFITGKTGRLFHTKDGGETWDIQDIHDGSLYEIEFPTNDVGYIVGPQVLLKTTDGGKTWNTNKIKMMMAEYIDFITEDIGYMGYSNSMPTIQKTTNGGGKWNYVFDNIYDEHKTFGNYYPFSFRNENDGAVCGNDVLLVTSNGGKNWEVAYELPERTYIRNVLAIGDRGWLFYAENTDSKEDQFFFCDNDFNCSLIFSGEHSSSSGELQKINDITYRFTYDTLDYISTDEGFTWNAVYTGLKGSKYLVDAHHGYSIYGGQIYKATFGIEELQVSVTKCADRSYELLPQFNGETIPVAIYLKDIEGNLTTIVDNIEITNETSITIDIPDDIVSGMYSIYIESQNNQYMSVETEMIEITKKTPVNVIKENANYRIVGQTIYAFSKDIRLYTITGIEIPITNGVVELQSGIYMLVDGEETQKIIIK